MPPFPSLHGLTSSFSAAISGLTLLFSAVDGLGQLSLASSLHGLTSGFLPLYAVLADLVDHVDGPAWDVVGLPSIDGPGSASAGLWCWCSRAWPSVRAADFAMVYLMVGTLGSDPPGVLRGSSL